MTIQPAHRQKTNDMAALINQMTPEIQRALPRGLSADRVARLALTALRRNEKLANCDPASFAGALMTAAALGLEPNVSGEAYLVPYKYECQLIIGYQGYAKLFYQSPLAQHIDAQAVYEKDTFDYAYGTSAYLSHKPAVGERGKVVAYYAVASLTSGATHFVVLTPEEVRELRGGKTGTSGGVADPMRWMERKTALRQLVKLLPRSTELNVALESDETSGQQLHAGLTEQHAIEQGVNVETGEIEASA